MVIDGPASSLVIHWIGEHHGFLAERKVVVRVKAGGLHRTT
jgi:hypothetical protein